mgnify:CR=1 FL=1
MRLVTRGDLDGLTSAVIITMKEPIEDILLVHPQEITDKVVEIGPNDILTNLPYDPRCGMWFDHHLLTDSNEKPPAQFKGNYRIAASAAVYRMQMLVTHPASATDFTLRRLRTAPSRQRWLML